MFKKVVAIFTTMVLLIALTVVSCAENTITSLTVLLNCL